MQTEDRTKESQILNGDTESVDNLSKTVDQLQKKLKKSEAEKQQIFEKLECLLFLIKRSWNGDSSATVYLARILGLDLEKGTNGVTEKSKRAVDNWFQLTTSLLDRQQKQETLRQHQKQISHIEQRYRYMEHVLHEHHCQMAQFTGRVDEEPYNSYHDNGDQLPQNSKEKRGQSLSTQRIKSATPLATRKASYPMDVDVSKLCFKDLLIQPAPAVPRITLTPKNHNSHIKRPVSAYSHQKKSRNNTSRPKTAASVGLNRRTKRQNAAYPVTKEKRHSISMPHYLSETEQNEPQRLSASWPDNNQVAERTGYVSHPQTSYVSHQQKVLVKNRVTFAPKTVQLYEMDELKKPLSDKNIQFKKSNLQLQIRLGIPEENRV